MLARHVPVALSLVLAALVAGCIDGGEEEVKVPTPDVDPATDANNTTSLGTVDTPTWTVGQWWAHHTYFGPDDKNGNHFNVVVTDASSGYRVASQSGEHAMKEAEMDLFDLGTFGSDLSTTYKGQAWKWYDWPLEHNKTWSQSIDVEETTYDLEFRATEATDLRTAMGAKTGFRINGTTEDGSLVMTYDYVLEAGWFADLEIFDPADPSTRIFKIANMGYGEGKTGEYVEIELIEVVNKTFTADTGPASDTLTVPEGTTSLVGRIDATVETGLGSLTLTDPDGKTHDYTVTPPGGSAGEDVDMKKPPAGEWSLTFFAVGTGSSATLDLTAVVETTGTL